MSTLPIFTIDIGSSNVKYARYAFEDGKLHQLSDEWTPTPSTIGTTKNGFPYRYLSDIQLTKLLISIRSRIAGFYAVTHATTRLCIVTGLTNSLVVRGDGKTVAFLDDPSATTTITPYEEKIIKAALHIPHGEHIPQTSSIMKLLSFTHHTDIQETLFSIKELMTSYTYGSLLGAITEVLSNSHYPLGIAYDDLRGFGSTTIDAAHLQSLLLLLGIPKTALAVHPGRFLSTPHGALYITNDFDAEIETIAELYTHGDIEPHAFCIGLDTVGKIISHSPVMPKHLGLLGYTTMRNCGRVNSTWMHEAIGIPDDAHFYRTIHELLATAALENTVSPYMFFPRVDGHRDGLLVQKNSHHIPIRLEHVRQLPLPERHAIVLAVACGVAFELRHMVEKIEQDNRLEDAPVYLYGGLGSRKQTGWIDIFCQCFGTSRPKFHLQMTSGALAATHRGIAAMGWENTEDIPVPALYIHETHERNAEFAEWKAHRQSASIF